MHVSAVAPLAASKSAGGSSWGSLVFFVLLALVVVLFMSSRRRQRATQQQQQSSLHPGTRVITTAGLHGTVVDIDGSDVLLEVAPEVVLRFTRGAVGRVLPAEEDHGDHDAPESDGHRSAVSDEAATPGEIVASPDGTGPDGGQAPRKML